MFSRVHFQFELMAGTSIVCPSLNPTDRIFDLDNLLSNNQDSNLKLKKIYKICECMYALN